MLYVDVCIIEYWCSIGVWYLVDVVDIFGVDFYVVKFMFEYYVFVCFDDELDLCCCVVCLGCLSMWFIIEMYCVDEYFVIGEVIYVCVDFVM